MLQVALGEQYDLETATSAEEADLMMESGSYDVLVCDHMLPGESGLDFLIRMKRRHPKTKRFLVTGYMNPEFLSRSTTLADLSGCILKPSITTDLAGAIERTLQGKSNF